VSEKESKILGLEGWGLSEGQLSQLDNLAEVSISLQYPGYEALQQYAPAERNRRTRAELRRAYAALKTELAGLTWKRRGSALHPDGVELQLPLHRLPTVLAMPEVRYVFISSIENRERPDLPDEPGLWAVEARFAIQIENQLKGNQTFEQRVVVVKALNEEEAKRKLLREFADYAQPYLNGEGRMVRWQFEEFVNVEWLVNASELDAALDTGLEVFSKLRDRRIQPGMEWQRP
jgi:hypothetical protein